MATKATRIAAYGLHGAFLLWVATLSGCATAPRVATHPSTLDYPTLNWNVPLGAPHRVTLKNGLKAYVAEDRSLPLVTIGGYTRGGAILDPEDKVGLGELTMQLLRSGGTEKYPADTLDRLMDLHAIQLSFSINQTSIQFSMTFLSEFTDIALDILNQTLFHPAFETRRFEKEQSVFLERIAHRFDNPEPIMGVAYGKAMYPGQANSRVSTKASVGGLTRKDCVAYHRELFATNDVIVTASGDFLGDSLAQRLEKLFGPAESEGLSPLTSAIVPSRAPRCLVVHREITQAFVRLGLPLFTRPHPDYYPMSILNLVLGGSGFTSRLGSRIRSDEGLTYSIGSRAGSNYVFPSTFYVSFHTKTESAARAVMLCLEELDKIRDKGITEQELADAKAVLIDGFPSSFRSPADIVDNYAWNEFYGRDENHFAAYPERIRAITADNVLNVARKYLVPDSLTYVVVGDTTGLLHPDQSTGFSLGTLNPRSVVTPDSLPRLP